MGNQCCSNDNSNDQNSGMGKMNYYNEKDKPTEDYALKIDFEPNSILSDDVKAIIESRNETNKTKYESSNCSMLPDYFRLPDNSVYQGHWKDGKPEGYGKLYMSQGTYYEGSMERGNPSGYGWKIHKNGDIFEGNFVNGRLNGKGQITWRNNTGLNVEGKDHYYESYIGEFEDNAIHGVGEYKWSDGKVYNGQWVHGIIEGKGRLIYPDGRIYEGEFSKDMKHGKGKLTMKDGTVYEGEWNDGKKVGDFTLKYPDNTVVKKTFKDGQLVKGD